MYFYSYILVIISDADFLLMVKMQCFLENKFIQAKLCSKLNTNVNQMIAQVIEGCDKSHLRDE